MATRELHQNKAGVSKEIPSTLFLRSQENLTQQVTIAQGNGICCTHLLTLSCNSVKSEQMATILAASHTLTALRYWNTKIILQEDNQASQFRQTLRGCTELKMVELRGKLPPNINMSPTDWVVLGTDLDELPSLQELQSINVPLCWLVALPALLRPNNHLKRIQICLSDDSVMLAPSSWEEEAHSDFQHFLGACRTAPNLKVLDIGSVLLSTEAQKHTILDWLRQPSSPLEKLSISYHDRSFVKSALEILKTNQWLRYFRYHTDGSGMDSDHEFKGRDEASILLDVLQNFNYNYVLVEVTIFPWQSIHTRETEMPWQDSHIIHSGCGDCSEEFRLCVAQILFLLHLNRKGRGALLGSSVSTANANDWITVMAKDSHNFRYDNVSAIFYYLRLNPSLIIGLDNNIPKQQIGTGIVENRFMLTDPSHDD